MATSIPSRSTGKKDNFVLQYKYRLEDFNPDSVKPARIEPVFRTGPSIGKNRLIFGENLHVLAALCSDKSIRGKVDLIYIDPPYATGGIFTDREQGAAYSDTISGGEFIEHLRTRLLISKTILSKSGSIFLHLDERFVFHAKLIMDEVFGSENFRNMIVRKKCNSKNYTKKRLGNVVDYILWYTKSNKYIWNPPSTPLTEDFIEREYAYVEKVSRRRYKRVPLHAPGVRFGETGQHWRGKMPPAGKHWQYPPRVLDEMDLRGEIYWSKTGNPRRKIYLDQKHGLPLQDIWLDVKDAHNQNCSITGYPTEKNLALLERIILAASNPSSLVLDFFCGSGTTAEAANLHGRNWICIDRSEVAIRSCAQRLVRGKRLMGDFVGTKFAERVFTPPSQFIDWSLWADLQDTGLKVPNELAKWLQKEGQKGVNSSANPTSVDERQSLG